MQSHDDFRKDFKKLKNKIDDLVLVKPRLGNVEKKKQEVDGLTQEIKEYVKSLQDYLDSQGKLAPLKTDTKVEYESRILRYNELLETLDEHTKECCKYCKYEEPSPVK